MNKLSVIALGSLVSAIVLASGCGSNGSPASAITPQPSEISGSEILPQGQPSNEDSGDSIIAPASPSPAAEPSVDEAAPAPAPTPAEDSPSDTAPVPAAPAVAAVLSPSDLRDIQTPLFSAPSVVGRLMDTPRILSPQEQDVSALMNQSFASDQFTDFERQVQGRVAAKRAALGDAVLAEALKQKVIATLREIISAERDNPSALRGIVGRLGEFIAAFKSGDLAKVGRAVQDADLRTAVENAYASDPYVLAKAGEYLELQFAEAYKDIAKAAVDAGEEVREQSTLVHGGDDLDLVYKLDCCFTQGFNHIHGLENADIWHEGAANWRGVADGIRDALNSELHPVDAAAAVRAIEEAGRSIREQADQITRQIGHW